MKIITKKCILLVLILPMVFYFSCAPAYVPNVVNNPCFSEKGEFQASGHLGISGFDVQSAYAVSKRWMLVANASIMSDKSDETNNYHRHVFGEMGGGYYIPMGKYGVAECITGAGFGRINAYHASGVFQSFSNVMLTRAYVQPSLAFRSTYAELALSIRIAGLYVWQNDTDAWGSFWEPVVSLKLGSSAVKMVIQTGFSLPFGAVPFNYQPFILSVGIQVKPKSKM